MRKFLKWTAIGLLGLTVVVAAAALAGRYWLASESGLGFIAGQARDAGVELEGLDGDPFEALAVRRIEVRDDRGPWLAAEDARVEWSVWDLLGRRVSIDAVSARRLEVLRPPESDAAAPPEEPSGGIQAPPVEIAVKSLRVEEIVLAEELAGAPVSLRLEGGALYAAGAANVDLDVLRLDGPGALSLKADYDLADERFDLNLNASDPAGGLATRLAGLPDGVAARLKGSGDLNMWTGRLTAATGAKPLADLKLDVSRADGAIRLDVAGDAAPGPFLPPDLLDLVGEIVRIELRAQAREDGSAVAVDALRIAASPGAFVAEGALDAETGAIRATVRSERLDGAAAGRFLPDAVIADPTISADVGGTLERPTGVVNLRLARAAFGDIRASDLQLIAEALPGAGQAVEWKAEATAGTLALGQPAIDPILDGRWRIDATGAYDPAGDAQPLTVKLDGASGLSAVYQGVVSASGAAKGAFSARAADLSPFTPLAGVPLSGPGTIEGDLDYGDAGFKARDIKVQAIGAALAGRLDLNAAFDQIDGAFNVSVPNLGRIGRLANAPIDGALAGDVTVSGPLSNPASVGELRFQPLLLQGERFRDARIRYDARRLATAPEGQVRLAAASPYGAIGAQTGFRLDGAQLRLSSLRVDAPGARAAGDIAVNLSSTTATGDLRLAVESLGAATRPFGVEAAGAGDGRVRLSSGRRGAQQIDADVRFKDVAVADMSVGSISATARGALGGDAPLNLNVVAEGLRAADVAAESATLTLSGPLRRADVSLQANGAAGDSEFVADVRGLLSIDDRGQSFQLTKGDGAFAGEALSFAPGLVVSNSSRGLVVDSLDFRSKPLTLQAAASLAGDRLSVRLSEAKADLAGLRPFMPTTPLAGVIRLQGELEGRIDAPQGRFTIDGDGIGAEGEPGAPKMDLDGAIGLGPGAVTIDLSGAGIGPTPLTVRGRIGLTGAAGAFPAPGPASTLDLRVAWSGAVEPVMALAPTEDHRLVGEGTIDLAISGTIDAPSVAGAVVLQDGAYEHLEFGTALDFDRIEILADGPNLVLKPFTARAGEGTIGASAAVNLQNRPGPSIRLEATFDNARLAAREDVTAAASGELKVEDQGAGMSVFARIVTDRVEVELIDNLPPDIPNLAVAEIGPLPPGREAPEPPSEASAQPITLDVEVSIPGQFFVRGRGLESEWQGNVAVGGTAARPVVNGQIDLKRGAFDLLGKRLALSEGVVRFEPNASGELEAILDILAEYEASDFSAAVRLEGVADQPEIILSSTPELPRDEILARLLFGKNAGALSAIESAQLAVAVASLAGGGGGGFDPVRSLRQATGIDALRVDVGAEGGPSVEAGKYLTDDVYVGVRQGAGAGQGAVVVEVELFDSVTIESESKQDGSQQIGGRLKWDY